MVFPGRVKGRSPSTSGHKRPRQHVFRTPPPPCAWAPQLAASKPLHPPIPLSSKKENTIVGCRGQMELREGVWLRYELLEQLDLQLAGTSPATLESNHLCTVGSSRRLSLPYYMGLTPRNLRPSRPWTLCRFYI